ncbi:cysteine-rich secretory protein LCCL domain-containing 1-like [Lineus longissimus]|uniref:cysteine-rich secretory protein LCCL domain-containing 1-like n=1 Tax=Lineus longissimus TaxID=88925 RepID=UPI00315C6898
MYYILCLVILASATSGQCQPKRDGRNGYLSKFGLTEAEARNLVDLHNEWRRKVNATSMNKLEWDDDLATDAMTWAKMCSWRHGQPSKPAFTLGRVGQNLGYTTKYNVDKRHSFDIWVDELNYYNFTANLCYFPPCGHYKQVMWDSSKKIGCAFHVCAQMYTKDGEPLDERASYLACNYHPWGNIPGERPYTPGEPCKTCNYCQEKLCTSREVFTSDLQTAVCKKKCHHCGTLTSDCKCECVDGTHGDECEYLCRDRKVECAWFSRSKCADGTSNGKVVDDFCDVLCEKCKRNTNTSWTCGNETYQNTFVKYASSPQYGYRTQDGKQCAFPFRYNGEYHNKCLPYKNSTWCSRSTNYDIYKTQGTNCTIVRTTDGNADGANCVFPFKYKGEYLVYYLANFIVQQIEH